MKNLATERLLDAIWSGELESEVVISTIMAQAIWRS